jgi:hypothetical protein
MILSLTHPVTEWRDTLNAALDGVGTGHLAEEVIQALSKESDLLERQPDLRDLALRSAEGNLSLIADMLRGAVSLGAAELPPQTVAYVRELARRNEPMTELARTYRMGQHILWRFCVSQIREAEPDPSAAALAIEEYTEATLATGEVLMGKALDRYLSERESWVRSVDAIRRATVDDLLTGSRLNLDAASARLRYELNRTHVAFVLWSEAGDMLGPVANAVGGDGVLLVPFGDNVMAGWCPPETLDRDAAMGAHLAVGLPSAGAEGFRSSHLEAMEARRVAQLTGVEGTVDYADVALTALLTVDLDQARAFMQRELGALAEPKHQRLADTALELLRQQGSPRRAGLTLDVHENTVAKRVRAAEKLLGRPVNERPGQTFAALMILRAIRPPAEPL